MELRRLGDQPQIAQHRQHLVGEGPQPAPGQILRQTALVAKQAAEVDILSRGRLRLAIGVGWNAARSRCGSGATGSAAWTGSAGWRTAGYPRGGSSPGAGAAAKEAVIRVAAEKAGRDPGEIGAEAQLFPVQVPDPEEIDDFVRAWRPHGLTHVKVETRGAGPGGSVDSHVAMLLEVDLDRIRLLASTTTTTMGSRGR